ncbi:AGE family epimerase/isomerase [Pseudooceanicola algae]|uniref:Sulfoquinovose isomerase n=1 Tax=Pseudooceanicola algae TaxID=1537215 RepID=A0A418SFE1_9RHOB|nr:AGE family epimerase/isomerase [Pseudooceanicola algae]QPM89201.1 Sulfoquinovose isomerase [Pseudooceanicola algae]
MTAPTRWTDLAPHQAWLRNQADRLLSLFEATAIDPHGGFFTLDSQGRPNEDDGFRQLHDTTRMIHCFALAELMGRPGAHVIVGHGLDFLRNFHADDKLGGYAWNARNDGAMAGNKTAYGHAFTLLAASTARLAGHDTDDLLKDVTEVIDTRFWEESAGAVTEEFALDWAPYPEYRGQNCNMHMTEALMAAYEATGDVTYLKKAERIAGLLINIHARAHDWRVVEHFDANWRPDTEYDGDPMFRPAGVTPGHGLEWVRLLVQLYRTSGGSQDWMIEAARGLFARAIADGWDSTGGGLVYTTDFAGKPLVRDRYWWPVCEGIGAAHALRGLDPQAEDWYRRFWDFAATRLIDHENGGWFPQLDDKGCPSQDPFFGKPDLYHALQACLVPLWPVENSVAGNLLRGQ